MRSRPERSSSSEGRKRLRGSKSTLVNKKNKKLEGVVRVAADPTVEGRTGLLKLCVTKLARMNDPESKLCRAVLINNTLRKCQAKQQQTCCHEEEREEEELEEDVELHSEVEEVKREGEVLVERMKMCQDIMDDYLDLINSSEGKSEDSSCDRTFEDSNPAGLADFVSPYSYNSFLSEVYEESISRILRKVDK